MTSRHHAFEFFLRSARRQLAERDGDRLTQAQIDEVAIAARREYEKIRLVVPDIGGARNVFQPVMTVNGWIAALHRALAAQGQRTEGTNPNALAKMSPRSFKKLVVSGDEVATNVKRLTTELRWHKNLSSALAAGRSKGKPVVWIQALGDLKGFL